MDPSISSCSVCGLPASVIMLDIKFCGSCFRILSDALRTRLTADETASLLRGGPLSQETRMIVGVVLSQLFRGAEATVTEGC